MHYEIKLKKIKELPNVFSYVTVKDANAMLIGDEVYLSSMHLFRRQWLVCGSSVYGANLSKTLSLCSEVISAI